MTAEVIETDVLIIGAGLAGCSAAIEARDQGRRVMLVTKGLFGRDPGATWMSHMSLQCWGLHQDTLDTHVEDTLRCGWFLNNQENVYTFLSQVPDAMLKLLKWGVRFKMKDGKFETVWQLGCSIKEGRAIYPESYPLGELCYHFSRVLPQVVRSRDIAVVEDTFMLDLLTTGDGIAGAVGIDIRTGEFRIFRARAIILAAGGYQGLYRVTTANPNLTGDGQAMALRAGADMTDFEFNQTLPSALWPPSILGSRMPFDLLVFWDGRMYNNRNERFMAKWDPEKMEKATRAILSRAIFHEIQEGRGSPHGGIYIGVTHNPASFIEQKRRETERIRMFIKPREAGIDFQKDYVETGYAMHYCQGGCNVNSRCQTDVPGLYAIGEMASGSKDGADRMMSNALPYAMATGIIAGREAAESARTAKVPRTDPAQVAGIVSRATAPLDRPDGTRVFPVRYRLKELMTTYTSYGRTDEGLKTALREIGRIRQEIVPKLSVSNRSTRFNFEWVNALEFDNMAIVAECIIRNALTRTESRGSHDRLDFKSPSSEWFRNIHLRLVNGELDQWVTPVEFRYWQPEPGSLGEPRNRGVQVGEYQGWVPEPLYRRM